MGDPGYRDGVNGEQRRNPAADVHKATEGLQMGHPGADDVPGHQGVQILLLAALLGLTAAQHRTQGTVRQLLKTGDHKAHRFAHPGEQRNIPGGA